MEPTAHYLGLKTIQIVQSHDYQGLKLSKLCKVLSTNKGLKIMQSRPFDKEHLIVSV
jgi:hypothetical protein